MYLSRSTRSSLRWRSANNNIGSRCALSIQEDTSAVCGVIESKASVAKVLSALNAARIPISDNTIAGVHLAVKANHGDNAIVDYYIEGEEIENQQALLYFQTLQMELSGCITQMIADFFMATPCFRQAIIEMPHEDLLFSLDFKNIAVVVRAGIYGNEVLEAIILLNNQKILTDETRLAIQQAGKDAVEHARALTSMQSDVSKPELEKCNNKSLLFKRAKYNHDLQVKKLNIIAPEQVTSVRRITGG